VLFCSRGGCSGLVAFLVATCGKRWRRGRFRELRAGRLEGGGNGDGGWEELGEPGLFVMIWMKCWEGIGLELFRVTGIAESVMQATDTQNARTNIV